MVSHRLLIRIGPDAIRAEIESQGVATWAADAPFGTPDELEQAIATLAAELPPGWRGRADVILLPPLVQSRRLAGLPPVRTRRALEGIVASQATHFFRRNGHPLMTSVRRPERKWWSRGKSSEPVAAAAVERHWLDAIGEGLRTAGLPEGTIAAGPGGPGFRSSSAAYARARSARRQLRVLTVMAGVLWCATGIIVALRVRRAESRLSTEIANLQAPASAAVRAHSMLEQARTALDSVAAARAQSAQVLAMLATVSSALPDSAFLTSLEWNQQPTGHQSGTIIGAARRAVDLVAALERAGVMQPRLEGAPLDDRSGPEPRERFIIQFGPSAAGAR